jgi:hypothetical protein
MVPVVSADSPPEDDDDDFGGVEYEDFTVDGNILMQYTGNGVTVISETALCASGLTSINVGSGNTKYSSENGVLFDKNKTKLIQFPAGKAGSYTMPNGVKSIEDRAFSSAKKLTSITFPKSLETIGNWAFLSCDGLTSVTLPGNRIGIKERAFFDYKNRISVTIPANVKGIGYFSLGYINTGNESTAPAKLEGFTINGVKDSAAEKYAVNEGFKFNVVVIPPTVGEGNYEKGHVLGNGKVKINDALEILKYLAGMRNKIKDSGKDSSALSAACITPASQKSGKPGIADALEIFKFLAGMKSLITK